MLPLFLDRDEVAMLTGFQSTRRQCLWLSERGWHFVINGSGRPIVARKYAEKALGCGDDEGPAAGPAPNFAALRGAS